MTMTNRSWLPPYCNPDAYLPKIQETRSLFKYRPYLFADFAGRALAFLRSDTAQKMGFEYDEPNTLPCKWKCADESVFGVDLAIYAYTGVYPFDKGAIGGYFNQGSLGAAVHHGRINIDFGGSHVGYLPDEHDGTFGEIWRPLQKDYSTDCGHLCAVMAPFMQMYSDACENILIVKKTGDQALLSIPNEFIQPNWNNSPIKFLVDTETLTMGDVPYREEHSYTHTPIGRTLFYLHPSFLDSVPEEAAREFLSGKQVPIGKHLHHRYFNIYDAAAELDANGVPVQKLNLYMKYILAAKHSPYQLKAAIVNTSLEYNRLTDAVRTKEFQPYSFASFTGVFIDMFDEMRNNYVNLFQPLGLSIKPAGVTHDVELTPEEIHTLFKDIQPIEPVALQEYIASYGNPEATSSRFVYRPKKFKSKPDQT